MSHYRILKALTFSLLLLLPLSSTAQNIQIGVGTTLSAIDWKYKYSWGGTEDFYTAPVLGTSFDIGVEYLEKDLFSLTSNFSYFQSGGRIALGEDHPNWVINEQVNKANNISLGTNLNVLPINKRVQLALSVGPRLDCLLPVSGTAMNTQDEIRRIHFGVTGGIGLFYNFEKWKVGLESSFLHRFGTLLDTEPSNSNNWWESPTLGVYAKDKFIVSNQVVVGFKL